MAHPEQMQFVAEARALHPEHFRDAAVLEIGSLNINGSVRQFFEDCRYVGLDVVHGPGVDVACPAHLYQGGPFDTVISCECLEHNPYWRETLARAVDMLRPGGLLVLTCAAGDRPEHGTRRTSPGESGSTALGGLWADYYRNLNPEDIREAIPVDSIFPGHVLRVVRGQDLQFMGIKTGSV